MMPGEKHRPAPRNVSLGYVRLSGRDEKEQVAPAVQREAVARLSHENGWQLELYDESKTGLHSARKRTNLPEWDKLYERALSDPCVAAVLFYDLSRGWRQAEAFQREVAGLTEKGVRVICAVEGEIRFNSADSQLIWGFRANISEYESAKTSERLRKHYAMRREQGIYTGQRAPFGLTRKGKATDGTLSFEPNEDLRVVVAFLELYTSRPVGLRQCATLLRKEGYYWRNVQREKIPLRSWHLLFTLRHLDHYRGHVPAALLHRTLRTRQERGVAHSAPKTRPPVLLYAVLCCAKCGDKFTQRYVQYDSSVYYSTYRHTDSVSCPDANRIITTRKVDPQVWDYLRRQSAYWRANLDDILDRAAQASDPAPALVPLRERHDKVVVTLAALPRKIAEDLITPAEGRALRAEYEAELAELRERLATAPPPAPVVDPDTVRAIVSDASGLIDLLAQGAEIDPNLGNTFMRELFERITLEGDKVVAIVPRAEYAALFSS